MYEETRWGPWGYDSFNMNLVIHSEASGYPKGDPYCVSVRGCNTGDDVMVILGNLFGKPWCRPEYVGYLLDALNSLFYPYRIQDILLEKSRMKGKRYEFSMEQHLEEHVFDLEAEQNRIKQCVCCPIGASLGSPGDCFCYEERI